MSRAKIILVLGAIMLIVAGAFWALLAMFKSEMRGIYLTEMERHAQATTEAIDRDTRMTFDNDTGPRALTPEEVRRWVDSRLRELVGMQESIKLATMVHPDGRILLLRLSDDPRIRAVLGENPAVENAPAVKVLGAYEAALPGLERSSYSIGDGEHTWAYLHLLYDVSPPDEIAAQAAARLTGLLIVILAAAGIVLAFIAQQQRMANRLREQRDQAEQLAYVGTLAAGLAHEIRNPINALAMQLEMLEEDLHKPHSDEDAGRIQRIRAGLVGVERTVGEFLNYASPGQQKPAMVDLAGELEKFTREFAAEWPRNHGEVECSVAPGLHAWCDVNALRQIMGNLLTNGWSMQPEGHRRLRVEAAREGDEIVIAVDDAGPGVPDDKRDEVFECFFSTRSDGTGLGLPIARRLAEMNGGQLELARQRSGLGGARFLLRLMARPPAKPA
jgi:signal transduction histidine kinase